MSHTNHTNQQHAKAIGYGVAAGQLAQQEQRNIAAGGPLHAVPAPVAEVPGELGRLAAKLDHVDVLLNDLIGRLSSVRRDEPPSDPRSPADVKPVESTPLTMLGQQLRDCSNNIDSLIARLNWQLRTLELN